VGAGGEMTQALYAHMNNKTILKKKKKTLHKNRTGGVAQGEGPEIELQDYKKKKKSRGS
jgi:hypothetical protein